MSNSLSHSSVTIHRPGAAVTPLHLLVSLVLALGALIWGATFIFGGEGLQLHKYLALLGFYGVSSAVFVTSRIRRAKLQLFEIPVFITAMFFLEFGLVPLRNFIDPTQLEVNLSTNGEELVQALFYIILGMMAFWVGCELARHQEGDRIALGPETQSSVPNSNKAGVLLAFGALYAVAFTTKVYLFKKHLYAYVGSSDAYYANLASMQVLNQVSQLGSLALIVATIERYRDRYNPLWRMLYIVALSSEILWGLISGMKGLVLQNFLVVALVSSFVMRRLNLRWFVILFFGLVLLYPVSNAYRSIVRGRGAEGVTSFEGAAEAAKTAFNNVGEGESTIGDHWREGLNQLFERLDLLTSVAQVLTLGSRASMVKGDVQWWMLPIYPFIPRFLWPTKPILDEGARFTLALQGRSGDLISAGSSTAVTYPGDLYLQFGLLGIAGGMFVLGVMAQWFTNRVAGPVEPPELFLYAAVFFFGFPYESDAFDMWASFIKFLAILYVVRLVVYGPRKRASAVHQSVHRAVLSQVQQRESSLYVVAKDIQTTET